VKNNKGSKEKVISCIRCVCHMEGDIPKTWPSDGSND